MNCISWAFFAWFRGWIAHFRRWLLSLSDVLLGSELQILGLVGISQLRAAIEPCKSFTPNIVHDIIQIELNKLKGRFIWI
jgi:hypothetical protein